MAFKCCLCSSKTPKVSLYSFPKNNDIRNLWKERCGIRLFDDVSKFFVCSKHFTPDDYVEPNAKKLGGRLMLKQNRFPTVKVPNPTNPMIFVATSTLSEPEIKTEEVTNPLFDAVPSASPEPAEQAMQAVEVSNPFFITVPTVSPKPAEPVMLSERLVLKSNPLPTEEVPNPIFVAVPSASPEPVEPATQTAKRRKFADPRYVGDIVPSDFATPKGARIAWHVAKKHMKSQNMKYRVLYNKNNRLKKKIASLEFTLKHLKENYLFVKKPKNIHSRNKKS